MQYFCVKNQGEIAVEAFTLLGASSKEGDNSKIGFFGSGNKYALAVLLRNNIPVRIFSGKKEITIGTSAVAFRGQTFERIIIDGVETGMTTRMGPQWETWMALRELVCNAMDEGDASWDVTDAIEPVDGSTCIYIGMVGGMLPVVETFDAYVLNGEPDEVLVTASGKVKLFEGSDARIYRKGILCVPEQFFAYKKSLVRYSLDSCEINESRVMMYTYSLNYIIADALACTRNKDLILAYLSCWRNEDYLEHDCNWGYNNDTPLSDVWEDALQSLHTSFVSSSLYTLLPPDDRMGVMPLDNDLIERIKKQFPSVPVIGSGAGTYIEESPSEMLKSIVDTAVKELHSLGISFDMPVKFCRFVNEAVYAAEDKGVCLISVDAEKKDKVDWSQVLLEEWGHKQSGYGDGTRGFASYFRDKWLEALREVYSREEKRRNTMKQCIMDMGITDVIRDTLTEANHENDRGNF